jgi:hypothetical protein
METDIELACVCRHPARETRRRGRRESRQETEKQNEVVRYGSHRLLLGSRRFSMMPLNASET